MILHKIRRPNSLKIIPSGVANCRNLPFGGRATRDSRDASSKKGIRAEFPPTFIRGKRRKNRKRHGLRTLSVKGSGVVFTHGEGISTPHICHKGRQPLIKCANMTSICFMFPFTSLWLFLPFIFLSFCGRQGCFPCSYVFLNCGKEIIPT